MSEINLNLDERNESEKNENIHDTQQGKTFLESIPLNEIAKVFTSFGKEKRVLVIPIGFPQAGKSFLLSSLMFYARKGIDTLFRTNIESEFPYDKGLKVVDEMVSALDKKIPYGSTEKGTIDLIGINITPNKKLPELKLAFLDLAGEDIKSIKTSNQGAFTDKINAVFNGLKISNSPIIFTLITPYQPARHSDESLEDAHNREDTLHYDFLNYITLNQQKLLKNAKFFVIVSQWDKNPNEKDSVEDFIKTHRPSVYAYVKNSNVIWGNYSIGEILETPMGNNIIKQDIVDINIDYPSRFWKKLYQICTNKTLDNKSFFQKLFG